MKPRLYLLLVLISLCTVATAQPAETIYSGNIAVTGSADENSYGPFDIGFNFTFFGNSYSQFYINSNGQVLFGAASNESSEVAIPNASVPNNFIAPFWDDLVVDSYGNILYKTIGAAPNRKLIVQFTNMGFYPFPANLGTFSVVLYESSNIIQVQYRLIVLSSSGKAHGNSATIGIENAAGNAGVQYAYHNANAVTTNQAISFTPSGPGYTVNSGAVYDGLYLTTNLTLPEPGIPTLISPPQDAVIGSGYTFQWGASTNAASYTLLIANDPSLADAVSYPMGSDLTKDITGLTLDATYYWGVFAANATGVTWCEIKTFTTSSVPPLVPVSQAVWTEQFSDKTIKLDYTGGDASPKTAIITSLPAQGQLYQYDAGVRGSLISSVPETVTGSGRNVIYAASGSSGNGAGNFNFKINDSGGDSPEGTIIINVSPPGVPNVLYLAKNAGVEIQFDIAMADPAGKQDQFTVTVNGTPATISSASLKTGDQNTIILTLVTPLAGTETVLAAYTQGDVTGFSGGFLFSFTDQSVTLSAQTITFPLIPAKKYGNSPFNPGATSGSGLGITYSSSNLSVATASGSTVTIVSPGTSVITARQAGNGTYAPAKYPRTLTVSKGDQTITFGVLPEKFTDDSDFTLSAVASSSLQVSYASDNTAVATVTGNLVHITGAGTTNITASQGGSSNYNAAPDVIQPLVVSTLTGLQDMTFSKGFNIYQSGSKINIEMLSDEWDGKMGSVQVVDLNGKTIINVRPVQFNKDSLIQIDVPGLKGIFVVVMKAEGKVFARKVAIR